MRNGAALMLNPANTGGGNMPPLPPVNDSIIAWYEANYQWDGTTWNDLSGNDHHLSQWNEYSLPVHSGSEFGGNGGLIFNNDVLKTIDTGLADDMHGLSNFTIFIVVRNINVTTDTSYILDISSANGNIAISDDEDHGSKVFSQHEAVNFRFEASFQETEQVRMFSLNSSTGNTEVGMSGDIKVSDPVANTLDLLGGTLFLGKRYTNINPANMALAEVLIYGRSLSFTEIDSMNSFLTSKWGLSDLTPTIDGIASMLYYGESSTIANLMGTATLTSSGAWHGPITNLQDLSLSNYWDSGTHVEPWIEAAWGSSQTINEVQLVSYSGSSNVVKAAYLTTIDAYWWNGSSWVHSGKFECYGRTLKIRLGSPISTDKLRFVFGEGLAAENATLKQILAF